MSRVKRTQIYLEVDLDRRLRAAAAAEGRSAAALIRDAVRAYLASDGGRKRPDPFLEIAGKSRGKHRDAAENHDYYLYKLDK